MSWPVLTAVLALALATWMSAVVIVLLTSRRATLVEQLREMRRNDSAAWLEKHYDTICHSAALLRTVLRLSVVMLITLEAIGYGEGAVVSWERLLIAGGISAIALWAFASVLATAIARHADLFVIRRALPVLRVVNLVFGPFSRGLSFVDEAVRRLSGANLREDREEAEAELLRSIEDSQREGGLDEHAATLLENVVDFSSTDVGEVMTPRTDIDGLLLTDDLAVIRAFIIESGHSRIPVYVENLDRIVGVLYVKDLIPYLGESVSDFKLRPILRQPIMVPETKKVGELLADFQQSEVHLGIVIDEYGGTAGLVTIEDVIEEIVGEIQDEHDDPEEEQPSLTPITLNCVSVDGRFHIGDLNEELALDLPEDAEYDTVAGFVLAELGRVPEVGESFETHDVRITTVEATPTHILRLEVELLNGRRRESEVA